MSRKKKKDSRRPLGFVGKPKPEEQLKRVVVFLFGLIFFGIITWSCLKTDFTQLVWWHYLVVIFMYVMGIYFMFIAAYPRQSQVNESHDQLVEQATRSIFRALMDKLF